MNGKYFDVAVIGAGASGLMAAISAADRAPGIRTVVIEKNNEPAKKLYATGNGRCNYLNSKALAKDYYCFEKDGCVPVHAVRQLSGGRIKELTSIFRKLGVEPFTDEEGRMYPRSLQAASVVRALTAGAKKAKAVVKCGDEACLIEKRRDGFAVVLASGEIIGAACVILACGGKAGIQYGCTGDGYKFARSFGHSLVRPVPALTKLICEENIAKISGVRARGTVSLIAECGGVSTVAAEDTGEIQFTEDCLSGICTFNVSRFFRFSEGTSYRAELDLLPEYSSEKLGELLLERRVSFKDEPCGMLLNGILPSKLADFVLEKSGCRPERSCESVTREKLSEIASLCKMLSFPLSGTRSFKDAQVTAGGVALDGVDPETLESLKVSGLFFAGEILDIDGPCGGYNLSWAFASGDTAGRSAAERVMKNGQDPRN